jgi:hypothetical protein
VRRNRVALLMALGVDNFALAMLLLRWLSARLPADALDPGSVVRQPDGAPAAVTPW